MRHSFDDSTDAESRSGIRAGVLMRVGSGCAVGTAAITGAKASSAAASAGPLITTTAPAQVRRATRSVAGRS